MNIRSNILTIVLMTLCMLPARPQDNLPMACAGSTVRYGVEGLPQSVFEWTVIGGTIINNYNDSIDVLWGNERGTYSVEVIEHSMHECMGDPYIASIDIKAPFINIDDEDGIIHVCEGETKLIVVPGNFKLYRWNDGLTFGPEYYVSEPGIIWVEVIDRYNCINRDSSMVQVHNLPEIYLGEDQILCGDDRLVLDAGDNWIYYRWSTGSKTQTIIVEEGEQQYSVEIRDRYCSNFDTINILVCLPYDEIKRRLPTAFTPNGDGHNDQFQVPGIERFPNIEVEIFDRWGRRVFKSDVGYTKPWDGTYDGQDLPMDSYYFIIDLKEGLPPIAGSVSIVR